jgi:transcriptional regulator of acetoin/glycerol metabolism
MLQSFDWPGNVRQLENLVERLVILSDKDILDSTSLPSEMAATGPAKNTLNNGLKTLDAIEKQAIIEALAASQGVVSQAAEILGIGQATVYRKIKRYGISLPGRSQFL